MRKTRPARTPPCSCVQPPLLCMHVPPPPISRGCAAHCAAEMQDCTIPAVSTGENVTRSCSEKAIVQAGKREEGTALRSYAFLRPLPPDFSTECHPLSPPLPPSHLFTSLNGEASRSQRASLRDHRIVRPSILIPSPLSRSETAGLFFPLHRLFRLNVLTVGICCKRASPVTCPSMFASEADLPESTLPSLPSKHTHLDFTDCH
ncbi:hypothetical protein CHARACLAT_001289 [Characodon lateralis]|uniref:Uncharacterized protein n=1 Tax=Characodon lateralis TaxID=208331 RepID=A0ABU7E7H0_9TELE|nr:hypothetical protein [Characodon lateralis]